MPSEYECTSCRLTFTVGPYVGQLRTNAGGAFLVCRACGTQHKVVNSLVSESEASYSLSGQPAPLTFFRSRTEMESPSEPTAEHGAWQEVQVGTFGELRVEDACCASCHVQGQLSTATSAEDPCPRCKQSTLRYVLGWMA